MKPEQPRSRMNYEKISHREIEILPGSTPIHEVLETMARISYESAKVPVSECAALLDVQSKEIGFSDFVHLECRAVLDMDYVNERRCKTKVGKTDDGKYIFDAWLYAVNRGSPELFLDKLKSTLEENVEDLKTSTRSDKPRSASEKASWIADLLDLLLGFLNPWT